MSEIGKNEVKSGKSLLSIVNKVVENTHVYKSAARRLVATTVNYLQSRGKETGFLNETNFDHIHSFNNTVFKFRDELGDAFAIKIFARGETGEQKYQREVLGRSFLLETNLFSKNSEVVVPSLIFSDLANRTQITGFIENLSLADLESSNSKISAVSEGLMVSFLVQLNELKATHENLSKFSLSSAYSTESPFEIYTRAVRQYENFKKWTHDKKLEQPSIVNWLRENQFDSLLDNAFSKALSIFSPQVINKKTEPNDMRFNWGDVSLSNLFLLKEGVKNKIVPLDLEYSGWDNFCSGVVSLVLHHQSENVDIGKKKSILNRFVRESRLNDEQVEELNSRLVFTELLFVTRKLTAVMQNANEVPGLKIKRQYGEPYSQLKIREFLEPAKKRVENGFLTI